MATIKGKWQFNDNLTDFSSFIQSNVYINFKAYRINDEVFDCIGFRFERSTNFGDTFCVKYNDLNYRFYCTGGTENAGGMRTDYFHNYIDFGDTEQTVTDNFYNWFIVNVKEFVEVEATKITYNETTTTITEGQTATIKCNGKKMASDLVINGKSKITYNNVETNVEEGQVATLKCNGKKMISDVVVSVLKAITAFKASITGLGNSSPTSQVYTKDDNFPTSFEEVTDSLGNIFIKIPTMYRKIDSVVDGQITAFTMSTAKVDDTYEPYSVFVKPNGSVMPYVLIGKYCTNSSTSMNSITSSTSHTNVYISNARTYAQALGNGYQQYDWQFQKLFVDLCLLISQKVNFNDGTGVDNYLGVYELNKPVWIDGAIKDNEKWYVCNDPTKYINNATSNTDGYVSAGYSAPTSSNKIKTLGYSTSNPFFNYPKVLVETNNTYYCDTFYHTIGNSGNMPFYSNIGFALNTYGLWHFSVGSGWSDRFSARLCYRPLDESI